MRKVYLHAVQRHCGLLSHRFFGCLVSRLLHPWRHVHTSAGQRRTLLFAGCCIALSAYGMTASAAQLYKYRDENGRWVMTDKKPPVATYEQERLVVTERRAKVAVANRGSGERPRLYGLNPLAGPVEMWLEFNRQTNLRFSEPPPFVWLLDASSEQLLLQLQPKNPNASWAYEWRYRYVPGRPMKRDDIDTAPLGIPVQGGPFFVSQSFQGAASHQQHVEAHYAVDIVVPVDTGVVAVRSGVVMETETDFSRSGWSEAFADEANMVRVLHEDGTMSLYAHLRADGVVVRPGQRVKRGQLLGYSGNTGFSTGPHLHFAWQMNEGKRLVSLPFQFAGFNAQPQVGDRLLGSTAPKAGVGSAGRP